jgi:hypothetical protein
LGNLFLREKWVELSEQEVAFVRDLRRILSAPAVDDQYDQLDGSL